MAAIRYFAVYGPDGLLIHSLTSVELVEAIQAHQLTPGQSVTVFDTEVSGEEIPLEEVEGES